LKLLPLHNHQDNDKIIAIVCNKRAGKGNAIAVLAHLQEKLLQINISHSVFDNELPENFDRFSAVWLVGGDGTVNFFINRFPHTRIPIALFKGGTGNDFAWKLYADKTIDEYLEIVLHTSAKKVDGGICNGRYFINGVGIGFDGEVVKAMGANRILSGHIAYLLTVLKKIFFYREKEMIIQTDKRSWNEKLFMLTVANGCRYGGGFLVAPQANINDGELDIVLIKKISRLLRLFYLPKVEKGKHTHLSIVEIDRAKRIEIRSPEILYGHLDGELMQADEFMIEILPQKFLFLY